MSQDVQLQAEKREALGTKEVKKLRQAGMVPAVVQEHGKDSQHIVINGLELLKAYNQAGKSQPIDLKVGSNQLLALIKQIEFIPLKPEVQHVVFQALDQNETVDAEIPIHIVGDMPAEQNRLAVLHTLETVEVRSLPKNLPEAFEISGESLVEVDDRIDIKDLKLPEGVELVELLAIGDDEERREEFLNQPIAIVKEPQVEEEPEPEVEEGAEGEVPSEHGSAEGEESKDGESKSEESSEKSD